MWLKILNFELKYRFKRPATYIYFAILFLLSFLAISTDVVQIGGGAGLVKENAPTTIATMMAILAAIFMMIPSAIMGVAVLRDYEHDMASIMFVNPISKFAYLAGRFLGSFITLLFVFSGVLWGFVLGEFMWWRDVDKLLPFNLWNYLHPFIWIVIPSLFFAGAIFFVSGALSRKMVYVYLQWIVLFIIYQITAILFDEIDNRSLASILDPFAINTINVETQYWTVDEKNSLTIPIAGDVLLNRIIWVGIGLVALIGGYFAFNFNIVRSKKGRKVQKAFKASAPAAISIPKAEQSFGFGTTLKQLTSQTWFYFTQVLKSIPFQAIVFFGMFILIVNSFYMGRTFGTYTYPTTYLMLELISGFQLFMMIILVVYSGELIWKEREVKINLIYDAMPVRDMTNMLAKFFGMVLIYITLLLALILTAVIIQAARGYYNFDLGVYFSALFSDTLFFLILFTMLAFFLQVMVNNKFLGYALMVVFFISTLVLTNLGVEHRLFRFGSSDLGPYSDMNGFGHYIPGFSWFNVYWFGLATLLFAIAALFAVRGSEALMKIRFHIGKLRLSRSLSIFIMVSIMVFLLSGCYIFYNTNMLNTYSNSDEQEELRAEYEKELKQFEYLNQPKITDIRMDVDIYPYQRDYNATGTYILMNKSSEPINEIHIQLNSDFQIHTDTIYFNRSASLAKNYNKFRYRIYTLGQALQPGEKMEMHFQSEFITRGFVEGSPNNTVVFNGTFFNSGQFPSLGYNDGFELSTDSDRKDYDLKPKERNLDRDDPRGLANSFFGDDADGIMFEMVVSTSADQIAIAPGYLQEEREENGRRYFHYKMDVPMANFYNIVSARYEVMRDKMTIPLDSGEKEISLEIYYHKGHEYNLDRMMKAMKQSFTYFSENFSPYQYRQMRIMEFPRYSSFAQSFANTVPFSEGIGFMLEIKDEDDVDVAFFVTAHELAHQWWGHQIVPANVQGAAMLSESLSQYSALMVMKHEYSMENMKEFLKEEMNRYLSGRSGEQKREMTLTKVESQSYIHYGKGAVNMFALQDYVGEDSVNAALRRFVGDWHAYGDKDRYPSTKDLIPYLREVTPDSLQFLVTDLFEKIILFENKVNDATVVKTGDQEWEVTLDVSAKKLEADTLGTETNVPIRDWIDIGVYTFKDGKEQLTYLKKHKFEENEKTITITVNEDPVKAGIDPINKLIDRNPTDNTKAVTFNEGT